MSVIPPRTLTVHWGPEAVLVSNIDHDLPEPSTQDARAKVLTAGTANPATLLSESAWEAVARATITPDGLAVQLQTSSSQATDGLLMEENVEGATLRSVITRVHLSELLPGIQPRTGMEVMETADPQVQGITEDGRPCSVVRYRYRDLAHLRDHVWQTIHGTLSLNSYAPSILARKVTRNLITHPVEISFEDDTESFHAVVVRDGITRLASAWAVLAGPEADDAAAADGAVQALFGHGPAAVPAKGEQPLGQRLAAGREAWRRSLRTEFSQQVALPDPGLRPVQIAQTYVLPAQIAVGVEGHPGRLLAAEDIFDDAIRSVLASVHVEFKQWDVAAQNVEVATRALKRVIQQGDSLVSHDDLQAVYGLAVGRIAVEEIPSLFPGNPPGTALWRSIYLVHALTRPELLERLKDQAKAIKGGRRMGLKAYAELLGPLIDLPWRSHKKLVAQQARNAWANGGVLTADVTKDWDPVPTDDFTTLVEPALAGDNNARCTLAVAGGVALIADKLLTRNVGSALLAAKEKGGVPFRADVNQIVEDLSHQDNELGLWTLALAAERFRSNSLPTNAVTMRQLTSQAKAPAGPGGVYIHFKTDLKEDDKLARDADGVTEPLLQWDVVWASNPARAESSRPKPADAAGTTLAVTAGEPDPVPDGSAPVLTEPSAPLTDERPASQRAADHRQVVRQGVTTARDALDRLLLLEPEVGGHTPVIPPRVLDDLLKTLVGLQTDIENLRRKTAPEEWQEEDELL
ncbi:hypothetical protein OG898_11425 [Streptomyces sp. NBC_00193]|uniref:hypothetical protein n=1 Tax=Streptomyces sp. NBC_00193 TaxID=2975675 RepID=UPI00225376B7|nr:hypothetical protein [Streptomyces sp. NBC_00193]MCX5297100.1 hypothetical protein [Streptomyces sp. NBC_00193]